MPHNFLTIMESSTIVKQLRASHQQVEVSLLVHALTQMPYNIKQNSSIFCLSKNPEF